jgi:thiopurine S-methyltransferase
VTGSELVGTAIAELFAENGLADAVDETGPFRRHRAERLLVLEGDAFAVEPEHLGGAVDAVYDRAALVALDPKTRERYVASLVRVLAPGAKVLLVTFDYDQSKLDGPPWAVTDEAVRTLYGGAFRVEIVEEREASGGPKFAAAGVSSLRERLYALTSLTPRG